MSVAAPARADRLAALIGALAIPLATLIPLARADEPSRPPPNDGFLGARRIPLAVDDCPLDANLTAATREASAAEHYFRGDVLFVQGEYEGAARELVASYCLNAVPVLLRNIAQSYERLVRYEEAVAYYERYVLTVADHPGGTCEPPSDVERRTISARVEVLRRLPSTVTVATEPTGSTIELANDAGRQALGNDRELLQVVAGSYEMIVSHPGYETKTSTITVGIGRPYSFSFRLDARKARLQIQAVPGDARIFVDGRLAGLGAYDGVVPLGTHDVMVEAPGRETRSVTVELVEGDNKPVSVELPSPPGSGRRHLIGGSVVMGGILGAGTGGVGGSGSGGGAGFVLGAIGGGVGGYLLIPRDVRLGTGSFLLTTGFAGALNGVAIGGVVNDGDQQFLTDDDSKGAGYGLVGGVIVGVGVGLVLDPRLQLSPGQAALFNSGVGWGAITGALFIPIFDATSRIRYATLVTGLDLGVVAGALLASRYDISRRRVVFIDLAGLAGLVAGLATESTISSTTNTDSGEASANYALAGLAVGLGLGTFLTRNIDLPRLPRLTPAVTRGRDALGGQSLLFTLGGEL